MNGWDGLGWEDVKNQRGWERSFVPWHAVGRLVVDYSQQIAVFIQHLIDKQGRCFFVVILLEQRSRHEPSHDILLLGGKLLHCRPAVKHGLVQPLIKLWLFGVAD